MRCMAHDGLFQQCEISGPHETIINSKGQRAVAHQTQTSLWSVPVHDLQVATAFNPDPQMVGAMLDRARHATPEDVQAGGANNEEELLACLQLGFLRGMEGEEPGANALGFTVWPNGTRAFQAGWKHAKNLKVTDIFGKAKT